MGYETWLSRRYLFSQRRERFVSVVGCIAIGGVALGCAALIIVLAVMSGFSSELRDKIVNTNMHLVIEPIRGGMPYPNGLASEIAQVPHVEGVSPYVAGEGVIRTKRQATGAIIRGIDPITERNVTKFEAHLRGQLWELTPAHVIIGKELAVVLGVRRDDVVTLIAPVDGKGYDVRIGGIFDSGMYEYDVRLVYVHLDLAQRLFGLEGVVTGLGVRVDNVDRTDAIAHDVARILPPVWAVRTWMDMNAPFFDAIKLEKLTMFIILTLIVFVAAANIVSTLLMMVMERIKDIGILKSIGATRWSIWRLFTSEGLLIGCLGTTLGVALGVGVCWAQETYGLVRLPSSVSSIYSHDVLPVQLQWFDTSMVALSALLISLVATLYPAWQAARMHPVEALRYE